MFSSAWAVRGRAPRLRTAIGAGGLFWMLLLSLSIAGCGSSKPVDYSRFAGGSSSGGGSGGGSASGSGGGSGGGLSIRVQGNQFVDAAGRAVQLRGVNFSGFESVAIQGWSPTDPSGGQGGQADGPNWAAIAGWRANVVRLPLNEASWLGYTCTDTDGVVHNPDPGGNYRSAVETQVAQANAAGLYVILDLHWSAPGGTCPMLKTQMADADHSPAFWASVAQRFRNNPAVLFELFNEPDFNFDFSGDPWSAMMQGSGGSFSGYPATSNGNNWQNVQQPWTAVGYQQLIDAVRAAGAGNVVLIGSLEYSADLSGWLAHRPTDPRGQMAAVWHAYPTYGQTWENPCSGGNTYCVPNNSPGVFGDVQGILAAGLPVLITETGDRNSSGTNGAPLVATVTRFADAPGNAGADWSAAPGLPPIGVIGWTWDVWTDPDDVLIKDVNGTPTDGYGQFFRGWMLNHP